MLGLRTLLVLTAVADLALSAVLWIGASRRLKDGLSQWAGALLVQACALALFALGGPAKSGAIPVGSALLALSMTLQAAALAAFGGRRLAAWIHTAVIAAVAVPLQLLTEDAPSALLFGGTLFGLLMI